MMNEPEQAAARTNFERVGSSGKSFTAGRRFSLAGSKLLAHALLQNTNTPAALFVVPGDAEEMYKQP